jgi:hypothetical protein
VGDQRSISTICNNWGRLNALQGNYTRASELIGEGHAISASLGDRTAIGFFSHSLAMVACATGDFAESLRRCEEALDNYLEVDRWNCVVEVVESVASAAVRAGATAEAARLLGAATAVRDEISCPRSALDGPTFDEDVALTRAALGEADTARLMDEGRTWSRDAVVAATRAVIESHRS